MPNPRRLPVRSDLLKGRRVLVTGAAGAIGEKIAEVMEGHGAEAIRSDKHAAPGITALDVAGEHSVCEGFAAAGEITDVVHCAGSLIVGPISDTSVDDFHRATESNLLGAFLVGREAARRLLPGSTITFIASQAGYRAGAHWGVYCALKAGVMRLAEALAQELGPREIRVNTVCPGSVETPMLDDICKELARLKDEPADVIRRRYETGNPAGRFARPEEIGHVCAFLASPLASYVSGTAIAVDGGEVSA